jgi:hypothetical protein
MRARLPVLVFAAMVLLLAACGGEDDTLPDEVSPDVGGGTDTPDEDDAVDGGLDDGFDAAEREAAARALLGVSEDQLEEGPALRVVRRGEEQLPGTMDLRPGRLNVELDDDGSGTYVVTRVVIEVPDGESIVVE